VVAEQDGRVVGSNFLDERSPVCGVGPVTVDPSIQNRRVGRALMRAVLDRAGEKGSPSVRLVQVAYHNRSLSLYTRLGFAVREPLATLQGELVGPEVGSGCSVRPATAVDIEACSAVCVAVHGHSREGELRDAVAQNLAAVVERQGRITGYSTGIGFFSHAVSESNSDLRALISAAPSIGFPGFIVPMRNTEMLQWCLARGLRIRHMMNLMTTGWYQEPRGEYLPSIGY
jgi:hypothetical protein